MNQHNRMKNRLGLPNLGFGVSLHDQHFPYLLQNEDPMADWFEIISEKFMDNYGHARHVLEQIAAKCPIVMHGVSMNIGSTDPLNFNYLNKLKELIQFIQPKWVSDHLSWTGIAHKNMHDLLPLPMTEESLAHVINNIRMIQDFLERPLIIKNPATYLEFKSSTFSEWDFLSEIARETSCGLLLDVNNVYISSYNHGYDAENYIRELPHNHIVQIHLAGPSYGGSKLADTHNNTMPNDIWKLYQLAQKLTGGVSTLLEWNEKVPDYPDLVSELSKSKLMLSVDPITKNELTETPKTSLSFTQ